MDRVYCQTSDNDIPNITIIDKSSGDTPLLTVKKWADLQEPFQTFEVVPTDCVLWNPWSDKAAALADMDDDGYLRYVCVEPGTVADRVVVPPGKALALHQLLSV